jgi:hypothetical protein
MHFLLKYSAECSQKQAKKSTKVFVVSPLREESLLPEHNGMGLAGGSGEHTASVGYTRDGQGWVNFGSSAMRNDGKQDGGDALELEARVTDQSKTEIMRQAARDFRKCQLRTICIKQHCPLA